MAEELPLLDAVDVSIDRGQMDQMFAEGYSPEALLQLLDTGLQVQFQGRRLQLYRESVHVGVLTLSAHSLTVLRQFERFFSRHPLPAGVDLNFFRLILALHDVGKPIGGIAHQSTYTVDIVDLFLERLNYPQSARNLAMGLLGADPIGLYLQGAPEDTQLASEAVRVIKDMADIAQMPVSTFFDLLSIYYTVDASSYHFLQDLFVVNEREDSIDYAPAVLHRIQLVRDSIRALG